MDSLDALLNIIDEVEHTTRSIELELLASLLTIPVDHFQRNADVHLLKNTDPVYGTITKYISQSQCHDFRIKLKQLFDVRMKNAASHTGGGGYRMMLWHGTDRQAIDSILIDGFRLPGSHSKCMFGNGIYFADRSSKAAQYCGGDRSPGRKGYMLLCDVKIGKCFEASKALKGIARAPTGFDSVKGIGEYIPDPNGEIKIGGCVMPIGHTIANRSSSKYPLLFNEYIVYDVKRIVIRFVCEVEFY